MKVPSKEVLSSIIASIKQGTSITRLEEDGYEDDIIRFIISLPCVDITRGMGILSIKQTRDSKNLNTLELVEYIIHRLNTRYKGKNRAGYLEYIKDNYRFIDTLDNDWLI
jgi:hypothetical protein